MINTIARTENTRIPLLNITNVKIQNQQISSTNKILEAFFKKFLILISKPVYTNTPNGIKISLLYFQNKQIKKQVNRKGTVQRRYWNKFMSNILEIKPSPTFSRTRLTFLVLLLSKLLQTNVQIELVRIKYVYHDSNILAQFLGIHSHRVTYGRIKNLLWNRVGTHSRTIKDKVRTRTDNSPIGLSNNLIARDDFKPVTSLTGFKIKISGRLAKQRVVPKKTVKTTYKGAISPNKYNLVDEASFTGKNKKGAYTIRVWTSHGIT